MGRIRRGRGDTEMFAQGFQVGDMGCHAVLAGNQGDVRNLRRGGHLRRGAGVDFFGQDAA